MNRKKILTVSGVALLSMIAIAAMVLAISPRIRHMVLGYGKYAADVFIDHLKGKPYSKSDYDGIDVSKHQGVIKWNEVAKDKKIQFVYIKADMGKGWPDRRYKRNINGARKAGVKVGSYHFLTSKASAHEQFRHFSSLVDPEKQDLIPMVDVEEGFLGKWTKQQLQDSLAVFSELVRKRYGRRPMIYSNEAFYNKMLAPRFNNHILYIACYSRYEPHIVGEYSHNLWQYSEHGHIRGIGEYVDLCRFTNGTTLEDIMLRNE